MSRKCGCGRIIPDEEERAGFKICTYCQEKNAYTDKQAKDLW